MTQKTSFQIVYDGPGIMAGSMDVRELAPALLAMGDLIEYANAELNGNSVSVALRVRSDFRTGSFEATLELAQTLLEQAKGLFGAKSLLTPEAMMSIIIGAITIVKWQRQRPIANVTEIDNGKVKITTASDYDELIADGSSVRILRNTGVRKSMSAFFKQASHQGIDFVEVRHGQQRERVRNDEAAYFEQPSSEDMLNEDVRTVSLTLLGPSFEEGKPWRLSDGASDFSAAISDQRFLEKVNAGLLFAKGDEIVAKVRYTQKRIDGARLRMEREVLEVLKHSHPTKQGQLF